MKKFIKSKVLNIVLVALVLGGLILTYKKEYDRMIQEVDYGYFTYHTVGVRDIFEKMDYIYKYGFLYNCPEEEKASIMENTRLALEEGYLSQDDYDNLMLVYNGGFLFTEYLETHTRGDFTEMICFINHDGYLDRVHCEYKEYKPYWNNGLVQWGPVKKDGHYYGMDFELL